MFEAARQNSRLLQCTTGPLERVRAKAAATRGHTTVRSQPRLGYIYIYNIYIYIEREGERDDIYSHIMYERIYMQTYIININTSQL